MNGIKWVSNFFDEERDIGDPPEGAVLPGSRGEDTPVSESAKLLLVTGDGPFESLKSASPSPPQGVAAFEIIGDDDRVVVKEVKNRPWRMICQLIMKPQDGGELLGTGWLAGPRTVVTAGHNVLNKSLGGWAKSVQVRPARNGDGDPPFGVKESKRFSTINKWKDSYEEPESQREKDFDFAAIHLPEPFEFDLGSFGMKALPSGDLFEKPVNVAGYPLSAPPGSPGIHFLYMARDQIVDVLDNRLDYLSDTKKGQSGAPVIIFPDGLDGDPLVVGVHAYGLKDEENYGPRITTNLTALVQSWLEHDK